MPSIKGQLISQIRNVLASEIAGYKAYDVPALCDRLGLSPGDKNEAFESKFRYASTRLSRVNADRVLSMARLFLDEAASHELSELVAKLEELELPQVTELTRRRVIAVFEERPLSEGILPIEMLAKVWPLASMKNAYSAEGNLEASLYQHTVSFGDWDNKTTLEEVGLLTCSQKKFFEFLEGVTHPLACSGETQRELVAALNTHIIRDGYVLEISGTVSGHPFYGVKPKGLGSPADRGISSILEAFNPDAVHRRWERALERRTSDPENAITLSRTLLEDVCKWIIHEAGETYQEKDDLPVLYRKLSTILNLAPDMHTETVFKQILGSCQSIVESLGSLRNKIGDAHSEGPLRAKPSARHAELAVNLAGTMATFLVSTWHFRQTQKKKQG